MATEISPKHSAKNIPRDSLVDTREYTAEEVHDLGILINSPRVPHASEELRREVVTPEHTGKKNRNIAIAGAALTAIVLGGIGFVAGTSGSKDRLSNPVAEEPVSPEGGTDQDPNLGTTPDVAPTPNDLPSDSAEAPVINPENPNLLGLREHTYQEILAYGNPMDLLDLPQDAPTEKILDAFSKALMVRINIDDEGRQQQYADSIFADPELDRILFNDDLYGDSGLYIARESFRQFPEEGMEHTDITYEVGLQLSADHNKDDRRPNSYEDPMYKDGRTVIEEVRAIDVILQAGTRPAGDTLQDQVIGLDYKARQLSGIRLYYGEKTYLDENNVERTTTGWSMGRSATNFDISSN